MIKVNIYSLWPWLLHLHALELQLCTNVLDLGFVTNLLKIINHNSLLPETGWLNGLEVHLPQQILFDQSFFIPDYSYTIRWTSSIASHIGFQSLHKNKKWLPQLWMCSWSFFSIKIFKENPIINQDSFLLLVFAGWFVINEEYVVCECFFFSSCFMMKISLSQMNLELSKLLYISENDHYCFWNWEMYSFNCLSNEK